MNELGFRVSYDKDEHEEKGLFMNLFNYTVRKDPKLAQIVGEIPENAMLRSPLVQNDIIKLMAQMVSECVAHEVKHSDAGVFTLMADGTRNKSRVENISCVLKSIRMERLLSIKSTETLDAKSLTNLLLTTLGEMDIDTSGMISQCYDGASCMSGEHGGVQKLMQDKLDRKIPFVHCKNHRLHLVVVDLVSGIQSLSQFFDEIGLLYNFFAKFKVDKVYEGTALKRVLTTRWSGNYVSVAAVVTNYGDILSAVEEVCDNARDAKFDAETVAVAVGLRRMLSRDEFLFNLVMIKRVLGTLKPADAALQNRETDINESTKLINTTINILQSLRSEDGFGEILKDFTALHSHIDDDNNDHIPEPSVKRKRSQSKRLTDFFVTESLHQTMRDTSVEEPREFKKRLLFEVLDKVLSDMRLRFSGNNWLYSSVGALSRSNDNFLDRESLLPLRCFGIEIPPDAELIVAKQFLQDNVPIAESQDSNVVLKELYGMRVAFPKVYKLAATVATFGSSSAVCECSFSVLTRIDRPTKRSMLQPRQANLVLLAYERQLTEKIDLEEFVDRFSVIHPRLLCS